MKMLTSIVVCLFALAVVGCISCYRNTYRTTCLNVGTQKIFIPGFKLYDSKGFSEVVCGELLPGLGAGSGPYNQKPSKNVIVEWKVMATGEVVRQTVEIELPTEFANYASDIVFYIDPDNKRVYVAYELYDSAKNKDMIVDSKGNPFDINQVRKIR